MVLNYFLLFFLLLVLVAVVPGTVMGWIAAKRIRESQGALHGMGFAALAALPLPMLLALVVILLVLTFLFRWCVIHGQSDLTEVLIFVPVLTTGLILWIKWFRALLEHLTEGEPIIAGFISRLNRVTVITLILVWLICGGLFAMAMIRTERPPISPPVEAGVASSGVVVSSGESAAPTEAREFQREHEMKVPAAKAGSRTLFLDLDRREVVDASSQIHSIARRRFDPDSSSSSTTDRKIEDWAARWGADLMFVQAVPKVLTAYYGGPMTRSSSLDYDTATPLQVLKAAEELPANLPTDHEETEVTLVEPATGETLLFRTREGGIGLLELRKSPDFPQGGVIVRYKTIPAAE